MKIAALVSRAGPNNSPLFSMLSKEVDLTVYYCSDVGVGKNDYDAQFGRTVNWGDSFLSKHKYKFLKNFQSFSFRKNQDAWFNPSIISELIKNNYDALIVYGWNSFTDWLAFFACFFTRTKILIWGENPMNQETVAGRKSFLKKALLKPLFKRVFAFLYIGEENRKFYKYYGVPDDKLFFVPYSTNNAVFSATRDKLKSEREELRKKLLNIKDDRRVILFVGKLTEKKRPMDILRAYQLLNENHSTLIALVFVGDGALRGSLEKYAAEYALPDVYFTGFACQEEVQKYYAVADVFILPSGIGETWGMVVNQAMCFGLPVIVSDMVGCGPDLVKKGVNGFSFPCGDVQALAERIKKIITSKEMLADFGRESKKIIERYSYEEDIRGIKKALGI